MIENKHSVEAEVQICMRLGETPWVTVHSLGEMPWFWAVRDCRREMDWIKSIPAQYGNPQGLRVLFDGEVYESDLTNSDVKWLEA